MKYLLVLLVVGVGLWLLLGRHRGGAPTKPSRPGSHDADVMVPCSHCGLHLPKGDAVADGAGRSYCSDAHRLAGPR